MILEASVPVQIAVVDSDTCDTSVYGKRCRWFGDYDCYLFPDESGHPKMLSTSGHGKTFRVLRCDECKKATGTK